MNSSPDNITSPSTGPSHEPLAGVPANWREAILALVSTRFSIFQAESHKASLNWRKKLVSFLMAGVLLAFAWACILTGGIASLSVATGWPWYWIALAAGAIHLIIGLVCATAGSSRKSASFAITKAEFKKDREWIENFTKKPTSKN